MALYCIKENPAKYISFNCSTGKSYFTQRDNELTPNWACNTTSMCIGLHLAGWSFPTGPYSQPEDNLTYFCWNDERVLAYYEENYPDLYNAWIVDKYGSTTPPNEVHEVLDYATNLWIGKTCTYWNGETLINDIFSDLRKGLPVVASGLFGTLNHVVCLVGVKYILEDTSFTNPQRIILDDPWGMTYQYDNYKYAGDNMEISYSKFISDIKPIGNNNIKWTHRFYKA